jgi:hypothetical protein
MYHQPGNGFVAVPTSRRRGQFAGLLPFIRGSFNRRVRIIDVSM